MLYFQRNESNVLQAIKHDDLNRDLPYTYRGDFETLEDAQAIADELGDAYLATDAGRCCSPRFDVQHKPQVGDKVSYGFNGDYYPCGEIASISKTLKKITTTTGDSFYRLRQTGSWKMNKTWSLVSGHHDVRNPSF